MHDHRRGLLRLSSARKQRGAIHARTWNLSQPEMVFRWGRLTATATAYEKADHVRIELVPNSGDLVAFEVDGERIQSLSFNEMEFVRAR